MPKHISHNTNRRITKIQKVNTENEACNTHNKVGKAVRETIKKLGGTMPEDLPTPEKSIQEIEGELSLSGSTSNALE